MISHLNAHRIVAVLLTALVLAGCDKNAVQQLPMEPLLGARIKFFNFGVNAPSVNFYADSTKLTAVQSGGERPSFGAASRNMKTSPRPVADSRP